MESPRRIRLVFEEPHDDGMKRSWILLRPHLLTVSDFCSYLLDFFLLHHYYPHGLILTMDGFVLPPLESISLLKDNDTVSVKKKKTIELDTLQVQTDKKKPVCRNQKLCTSNSKRKKNPSPSTARCVPAPQETTLLQQQTINIDFNKLRPCTTLPKKGDIIAYRFYTLSRTWKTYLTSFKVGKVCELEGAMMILNPVPEYRFVFKEVMNGESTTKVAEDWCSKAHYNVLIDVKIVKRENSKQRENAWDEILLAIER